MKFCNCDYCYFLETCDPNLADRERSPLCVSYLPCANNFTDEEIRLYCDNLELNVSIYMNILNKKVLLDDKI